MDALSMIAVHIRRAVAPMVLLIAAMLAESSALAQIAPSEYDLKAAFVYQFLTYVSWPESKAGANGVIVIGVVGAPELADNLATLSRNQEIDARLIEVRNLTPDGDPRSLHVLFVARNPNVETDVLLQAAVDNAVLTITEELPRPSNSIINFEIIDSKVRFDVALGLARRNGLDVSGRLLQVALRVLELP